MKTLLKKIIPTPLFHLLQPVYHFLLALLGALYYRFPSRDIHVVAITGTKGKTTSTEIVNALLEEAGYKTAIASTLRFKIGDESKPNLFKMTMPGRFFLQRSIREAVKAECDTIVIEMTSEGAKQFRHLFIHLDALIYTNLAPEHIEAHGSFEKYKAAKLRIAHQLERSRKKDKAIIANGDDEHAADFLAIDVPLKKTYAVSKARVKHTKPHGMTIESEGKTITTRLSGTFNASNILGAVAYAQTRDISFDVINKALLTFEGVPGRVEYIQEGQPFTVIVDYAHTPDSLRELYKAFSDMDIIAVLGNTGGGRDKWKRPEMGCIADKFATHITLTNEDPYDENPYEIVEQMKVPIKSTPVDVVMNRQEAIRGALKRASERPNPEKRCCPHYRKRNRPFHYGSKWFKTSVG